MKKQFTLEEQAEIKRVMELDGVSRRTAIRRVFKTKAAPVASASTPNPMPITVAAQAAPAVTALPVVKLTEEQINTLATEIVNNSKPEVVAGLVAAAASTLTPAPKTSAAGAARKEGMRLFQLAGKPKPEDFIHVYGAERGVKATWVERAKIVGLATAEEAAKQFQTMRAGKPQEFVKAQGGEGFRKMIAGTEKVVDRHLGKAGEKE